MLRSRICVIWAFGFGWMIGVGTGGNAMAAPAEMVHVVYRADQPFPEFIPLWHESWRTKKEGDKETHYFKEMPLGGYIHIYVRNTGDRPLTIKDARLDGISLTEAIRLSKDEKAGIHPASVRIAKIPQEQIDRLIALGEPVWWKADPDTVAPGGLADITIRLRRNPPEETVKADVVCGDDLLPVTVPVNKPQPYLAGVSFALDFSDVVTYVRSPGGKGAPPTRFSMDGRDVTAQSTILSDPALDTAVILTTLSKPVDRGSFHYFQADFADGSRAAAGLRAVADEFRYGMWGYINKGATPRERAEYFLKDMEAHNINVLMYSISKDVSEFLMSEEGAAYSQRTGIRMMANWPGNARKPVYFFLLDEPDAQDYAVGFLESGTKLGALAQGLVLKSKEFRAKDPVPPILLNIDNTYKPENWYMYGQLPDVMCADPYYSGELASALRSRPYALKYQEKPTYVYAVTTICRWACAPRPLHIILNCVRDDNKDHPFRFSTPIEKRIEVYYAIAAGATSLSYWWYTPYDDCYGVGGDDALGKALWKEMGILGAEVRTAGEVLTRSCPATLPIKASDNLWVRTLLAGRDTVVLVVINDTTRGTRNSTTVRTVSPAQVTVQIPGWLKEIQALEIDSAGVKDIACTQNGPEITLGLKQVRSTRLVMLTQDPDLRDRLRKTYEERFAGTVRRLKYGK
ncbi:MAG TPA: hypothetical protein VLM89_12705 [Phycisphaerae bacterium]|nr:hypothetical protein [Phycisphaerae bacterium]